MTFELKVLRLIKLRIPMNKEPPTGLKEGKESDESEPSSLGSSITSSQLSAQDPK